MIADMYDYETALIHRKISDVEIEKLRDLTKNIKNIPKTLSSKKVINQDQYSDFLSKHSSHF